MYTLDLCFARLEYYLDCITLVWTKSRLHLEFFFFKNQVEQLLYQRYRLYRFLLSVIYIYIHKFAYVYAQFEHTYKKSALKIISGTILWLKAL